MCIRDSYIAVRQAAVSRALRAIGFVLSIVIPALYVALLVFHQELLPTRLLLAIAAAQKGVPLPPFLSLIHIFQEAVCLTVSFFILFSTKIRFFLLHLVFPTGVCYT